MSAITMLDSKPMTAICSLVLHEALASEGLIVAHSELTAKDQRRFTADTQRYTIIKPTPIPFISYPYEWSFLQLKAAALLTLRVQRIAREHGMVLKDASAYNGAIYRQKKPIFIDTLSFATYQEVRLGRVTNSFCEHFIAPLAVARYNLL